MVKADLTRDYYADLGLLPTADAAQIKKAFKTLAFKHHPDRNPGREAEVIADFQRIQSAHEVLIDVTERAKYDSNRKTSANNFRNSYANYSGGTSANTRGNPWSNVSSQFPAPPKAPTRARPTPTTTPSGPSAGAQRYTNNFKPPTTSAYQAAQNEPRSRQDTYNAFDRMHHRPTGPGTSWAAPEPPPRGTPKSGREESNARAKAQAEKAEAERVRAEAERARSNARPGFNEYREPNSSQHRSPSKGFHPNTPGGDEPPAPRGAYATARDKPMAPPPPPRQTPATYTTFVTPDPLQQFRKPDLPSMETRSSQPYSTHGGEKFNLHGSPNVSRSKSTREGSARFDDEVPRNGSDSSSNTPHRTRSAAQRTARPVHVESSSSDDLPEMRSNKTKPSGANQSDGSTEQVHSAAEHARKQSKIELLRQWMAENPGQEPPPNGPPSDGSPPRNYRSSPEANGKTTGKTNGAGVNGSTNGQPSMYAKSAHLPFTPPFAPPVFASSNSSQSSFIPRNVSQKDDITRRERSKYFPLPTEGVKVPATAPSGLVGDLSPFEKAQQTIVNQLVSSKRTGSYSQKVPVNPATSKSNVPARSDHQTSVKKAAELESPSKKSRKHASSVPPFDEARAYWQQNEDAKNTADHVLPTRFSFPINKDTFTPNQAQSNGFNSSAENISTKFTPEDWNGTFAAGSDYFQPTGAAPRVDPRSQAGSRARGTSPNKVRPTVDSKFTSPTESEKPIESPGGTRFSAEEWKETFKAQTFMPPSTPNIPHRPQSGRKRTMPSQRSTMGGRAAIIDESDNSDGKPLFDGPRVASPEMVFPDMMDVDTPPAPRVAAQFAPTQTNGNQNGNIGSPKRPAAPRTPSLVDQEDLAINFDDLKIKGFNLEMPAPPMPPVLPGLSDSEIPSREAFDSYTERHAAYMHAWDACNKQFLLHFVARQTQSDNLKDMRWTDEQITEAYRLSLKEDQAVQQRWAEITRRHDRVVREWIIMKARMGAKEMGDEARSRKKMC